MIPSLTPASVLFKASKSADSPKKNEKKLGYPQNNYPHSHLSNKVNTNPIFGSAGLTVLEINSVILISYFTITWKWIKQLLKANNVLSN